MPKKKQSESQDQQSERFRAEVERMIAAGELSPTEAETAIAKILNDARSSLGKLPTDISH